MTNVFQRILREQYAALPETVQRFHEARLGTFAGKASVNGADRMFARLARKLAGLPKPAAGEIDVSVRVIRSETQERWNRQFGVHQFSSRMNRVISGNLLRENFGLCSYYFSLSVRDHGIHWQFERWDFIGIPLPEFLAPDMEARESVDAEGRYQFWAKAEHPLCGVLLEYSGWLDRSDGA